MEAQRIQVVLHDVSAGYEVSLERVPLSLLRAFVKDVDELLRGDVGELDTSELQVAVVKGSLGILAAPTANPALLQDLQRLAASELIDAVNARRRAVVERWQKLARGAKRRFVKESLCIFR